MDQCVGNNAQLMKFVQLVSIVTILLYLYASMIFVSKKQYRFFKLNFDYLIMQFETFKVSAK